MRAIFDILYNANADVVLTGHDHLYERFATADRRRPRRSGSRASASSSSAPAALILTTGLSTTKPNSESRITGQNGVLKLTLLADSYQWEFVTTPNGAVADSGPAHVIEHTTEPSPLYSAARALLLSRALNTACPFRVKHRRSAIVCCCHRASRFSPAARRRRSKASCGSSFAAAIEISSSICPACPAIDSAGIRALVRGHTSAQRAGGSLRLAAARPAVSKVLELSHLASVFESYDIGRGGAVRRVAVEGRSGSASAASLLCTGDGVRRAQVAERARRASASATETFSAERDRRDCRCRVHPLRAVSRARRSW